jgi:purine nucleoside permease
MSILVIIGAMQASEILDKGKGLNSDEFQVLSTEKLNAEAWWDTLDYHGKVDVGGIAIHYNRMSASYRWHCGELKFKEIKKGQQRIIKYVFSKRDNKYMSFPLESLIK